MPKKSFLPDLKQYLDKRVEVNINASRVIHGYLKGFDNFMNLVLENAVEIIDKQPHPMGITVIRGNVLLSIEPIPQ
ncbi:hypothetical protein RCL1_006639 [Eukaryota sp. TZLM3-RCL]